MSLPRSPNLIRRSGRSPSGPSTSPATSSGLASWVTTDGTSARSRVRRSHRDCTGLSATASPPTLRKLGCSRDSISITSECSTGVGSRLSFLKLDRAPASTPSGMNYSEVGMKESITMAQLDQCSMASDQPSISHTRVSPRGLPQMPWPLPKYRPEEWEEIDDDQDWEDDEDDCLL